MTAAKQPATDVTLPAPVVGAPTEAEVLSARRAVAQHRRRRYPDTGQCGYCPQPWRVGETRAGRAVEGCERRREALDVLDAAGLLDTYGTPVEVTG